MAKAYCPEHGFKETPGCCSNLPEPIRWAPPWIENLKPLPEGSKPDLSTPYGPPQQPVPTSPDDATWDRLMDEIQKDIDSGVLKPHESEILADDRKNFYTERDKK